MVEVPGQFKNGSNRQILVLLLHRQVSDFLANELETTSSNHRHEIEEPPRACD